MTCWSLEEQTALEPESRSVRRRSYRRPPRPSLCVAPPDEDALRRRCPGCPSVAGLCPLPRTRQDQQEVRLCRNWKGKQFHINNATVKRMEGVPPQLSRRAAVPPPACLG